MWDPSGDLVPRPGCWGQALPWRGTVPGFCRVHFPGRLNFPAVLALAPVWSECPGRGGQCVELRHPDFLVLVFAGERARQISKLPTIPKGFGTLGISTLSIKTRFLYNELLSSRCPYQAYHGEWRTLSQDVEV